jgi:hypothetical protein
MYMCDSDDDDDEDEEEEDEYLTKRMMEPPDVDPKNFCGTLKYRTDSTGGRSSRASARPWGN